jgi:hypothetical protein
MAAARAGRARTANSTPVGPSGVPICGVAQKSSGDNGTANTNIVRLR